MRQTFRKRTFLVIMIYLLIAVALLAVIAAYFVPFKLQLFSERQEQTVVSALASNSDRMRMPQAPSSVFRQRA